MTEEAFWLVWNQGGGVPTVMHDSFQSATTEAERLARQCPGQRFVVLRSVAARAVDSMQRISYVNDDEIPF